VSDGGHLLCRIEAIAASERHLAVHDGHLIRLSTIESETVPREVIPEMTVTGTPDQVRAKLEAFIDVARTAVSA
jgi:5,10-methylenetetrahydromethanopterin reductase